MGFLHITPEGLSFRGHGQWKGLSKAPELNRGCWWEISMWNRQNHSPAFSAPFVTDTCL